MDSFLSHAIISFLTFIIFIQLISFQAFFFLSLCSIKCIIIYCHRLSWGKKQSFTSEWCRIRNGVNVRKLISFNQLYLLDFFWPRHGAAWYKMIFTWLFHSMNVITSFRMMMPLHLTHNLFDETCTTHDYYRISFIWGTFISLVILNTIDKIEEIDILPKQE